MNDNLKMMSSDVGTFIILNLKKETTSSVPDSGEEEIQLIIN